MGVPPRTGSLDIAVSRSRALGVAPRANPTAATAGIEPGPHFFLAETSSEVILWEMGDI